MDKKWEDIDLDALKMREDTVDLEQLLIVRDEGGRPEPNYVDTDYGPIGLKPSNLHDLKQADRLSSASTGETELQEMIDFLKEMIIDPMFDKLPDEFIAKEFDAQKLVDLINQANKKALPGGNQGQGGQKSVEDIKNPASRGVG